MSILCPTCNTINWADMDAVTCNVSNNAEDLYYFFDFDNDKMYILTRLNKDTNNASFVMIDATFKIAKHFIMKQVLMVVRSCHLILANK
ncbi:MAG: hypothetical protein IPN09_11140 [Bacteroidetes bacterium]|nr:hypothetical protein [Bacteroidota bacterium]